MQNEKIKELEDFANDFNNRLDISEHKVEDEGLYKKLSNKNNNNKLRGKIFSKFNSISNSPIRSKSQFRPVITNFYNLK